MADNRPEIIAKFVLDEHGVPQYTAGKSGSTLKHYLIKLSTEGVPDDAGAVTYELDPTYYDSLREVTRASVGDSFQEEITSYGDYPIHLSISGSSSSNTFRPLTRTKLSDALRRGHASDLAQSGPIKTALGDIQRL
jgi:hypothetical protein